MLEVPRQECGSEQAGVPHHEAIPSWSPLRHTSITVNRVCDFAFVFAAGELSRPEIAERVNG